MKNLLQKILPEKLILTYHYLTAILATLYYNFPSKKMVVVGVTGTKGKTSTANFIWSCLTAGGYKTGMISTANIRIGKKEFLNAYHMTMPGRFTIQKLIAQMAKAGCQFCIIETTSEGIKQYRHAGIYYDTVVFTNLSPEHLNSHENSLEKYKREKGKLFQSLTSHKKTIKGKMIQKIIIANKDDREAGYFLNFKADKKITFAINNRQADYIGRDIQETNRGINFKVGKVMFKLNILGKFNAYNALPAIIIGRLTHVNDELIKQGLAQLKIIPGRMEKIEVGQNFIVLVDYAHEGVSMRAALTAARKLTNDYGKLIVLLGAEGGGRDKAKRSVMGKIAGKLADWVIVSTVDPYNDDPSKINEEIALASERAGKIRTKDLLVINDRRAAIKKALSLAEKPNDVVIITGKGSEQSMQILGRSIPWDDRKIVKEELTATLANDR